MSFETLQVEQDGAIATVTLNRPAALNAINLLMLKELAQSFDRLASDPAVRVILVTGGGDRAFAAGADIRELGEGNRGTAEALTARGQRIFNSIERCGKPVIACVHGVALGGGLELALACTWRIADENARFGLPEAKLGLVPGFGGLYRLIRSVGRAQAMRLLLTAATIGAGEALQIGLIQQVTPTGELMASAREAARACAALAPLAIRSVLDLVERSDGMPASKAFAAERGAFAALSSTADKREGLAAFLEKRPPVWTGR